MRHRETLFLSVIRPAKAQSVSVISLSWWWPTCAASATVGLCSRLPCPIIRDAIHSGRGRGHSRPARALLRGPLPPQAAEGLLLVLHTFAAGHSAVPIAKPEPTFSQPEPRARARFGGLLASATCVTPSDDNSVISRLGVAVRLRGPCISQWSS